MTTGDKFGKLTVLELLTASEAGHPRDGAWCRVRCSCGTRKNVRARHLRAGGYASCGCKRGLTVNGVSLTRIEWSLSLGLRSNAVSERLRIGWPSEIAVTARKYFHFKRRQKERQTA